ncbi:MAG: HAD family hydrolase [Xanthomonadaceae bacterium]|nr:HAD family hydrolase [Xanthomonadaceae bacterium]
MILALFDFDGTITTRETMPDFVRMAVPRARLRLWGTLLAPWVFGYKAGLVSGSNIREKIARAGFRGMPVADYRAAGERFARDVLPTVLRPEAMARLAWHKARGDTVVVVSGGFDVYLSHWCSAQGVELICSKLEVVDGVLTGRFDGAQCVLAEKARRVRERYVLRSYSTVHAYGDTAEDAELLALADESWLRSWPDA